MVVSATTFKMRIILFWLVVFVTQSHHLHLPKHFSRCRINNAEFDICMKNAFNKVKPHIGDGIEELKLPPFRPFKTSGFKVAQNSSIAIFKATALDFRIQGLDKYNLLDFHYDISANTFSVKFNYDFLFMTGLSEVNGTILSLQLKRKVAYGIFLKSIDGKFKIEGKIVKKTNKDYYHPEDVQVSLMIKDASFDVSEFRSNNKRNRLLNRVFNGNSQQLIKAIIPGLEKMFKAAILSYLIELMGLFSFEELFPLKL